MCLFKKKKFPLKIYFLELAFDLHKALFWAYVMFKITTSAQMEMFLI